MATLCPPGSPGSVGEYQVHVFEEAKRSVAAYRHILAESGLGDFTPTSPEDWRKIPCIDKGNYINRFSPQSLSPEGHIATIAHASSGSSGEATFWFRGRKQKRIGTAYFARVIDDVMGIPRSQRTLVIVCFAMGVWVAGTYSLMAFEQIGEQTDRNLTVISPGMEVEDVSAVLVQLARHFDNTVIVGYPTALDMLVSDLHRRMNPLPEKLYFITSGDKVSEEWRDTWMRELGILFPTSLVNVYGSADAGLLAIETPLSIEIRRRLRACSSVSTQILGDTAGAALFQFDPSVFYFEEVGGELVFTCDLDTPLVRYNIHDCGKVISYKDMMTLVKDFGIQNENGWPFPFLIVSGRTDVAVVLYGAKVHAETLQKAFEEARNRYRLIGSFLAYSIEERHGQLFCIDFELSDATSVEDPQLSTAIASVIQERLIALSSEYRNSCQRLGSSVNRPRVRLYLQGDPRFLGLRSSWASCRSVSAGEAVNALFWPVGGKPKMVTLHRTAI